MFFCIMQLHLPLEIPTFLLMEGVHSQNQKPKILKKKIAKKKFCRSSIQITNFAIFGYTNIISNKCLLNVIDNHFIDVSQMQVFILIVQRLPKLTHIKIFLWQSEIKMNFPVDDVTGKSTTKQHLAPPFLSNCTQTTR